MQHIFLFIIKSHILDLFVLIFNNLDIYIYIYIYIYVYIGRYLLLLLDRHILYIQEYKEFKHNIESLIRII